MPAFSSLNRRDISAELMTKEYWPQGHSKQVYPIWHYTCRDIAFFYSQPPGVGVGLESSKAYDYDGNHPETNSPMVCGACHETIKKLDLCDSRPGELLALPGENPIFKVLKL